MTLATYRKHQEFFNAKAATWKTSENQVQFIKKLGELIGLKGHETVLDIGCGTGSLFKYLNEHLPNGKILGVDFAFNMLQKCSVEQSVDHYRIQSLAEELPIRSNSADIVLNYCLYPHLKFKHTAIREFNRVLKPEGKYFIIHPIGKDEVNSIHNKIGGPVCFDFIEPIESVVTLLQLNGFDVLEAFDEPEKFLIKSVKVKTN